MRSGCRSHGIRRGRVAVAVAFLLVASACGGGGTAAPEFDPIDRVETTLPPKQVIPTTTATPTTVPEGSDPSSTTLPPTTTLAPTTTTAAPIPVRFNPTDDGWNFRNYRAGNDEAFGVEDAIALFGAEAVCVEPEGACTPTPAAAEWIQMVATSMGYGVCEGMTVSALDRYLVGEDPQTGSLPLTPDVQRRVARLFSTQYLDDLIDATKQWRKRSVAEIVAELEEAFADPEHEQYTLGVYTAGGGHSVVPRDIEWQPDGRAVILVYDPNWPGRDRYVEVDPENDSWRFGYFGPDQLTDPEAWTGTGRRMDLSPLSVREAPFPEPFKGSGTGRGMLLAVTSVSRNWTLNIGGAGGATKVTGETAVPGEKGVVAVIRAGTFGADTILIAVPEQQVTLVLDGESRLTAMTDVGTASVQVTAGAEVGLEASNDLVAAAVTSEAAAEVSMATEKERILVEVPEGLDASVRSTVELTNIEFIDDDGAVVEAVEIEGDEERVDIAVTSDGQTRVTEPETHDADVRVAATEELVQTNTIVETDTPSTTVPADPGTSVPASATSTTTSLTTTTLLGEEAPTSTPTSTTVAGGEPVVAEPGAGEDCTVDYYDDGSESGWCEDGSSWWIGGDGYWWQTDVEVVTGCWVTTSSDLWESGWCDGSQGVERSWYDDGVGYRSESVTDPESGCTRSTDSTGFDETWCPEIGRQASSELDVVVSATTIDFSATEVPTGCTREFYDNGSESGWCEDGSSWWIDVDGYTSRTDVDPTTGCSRSTDSTGFDQTWCPELAVFDVPVAEAPLTEDPPTISAPPSGCEVTYSDDGSESGWCEDGSSWWIGSDGFRTRTDVDAATGCTSTTGSDGFESSTCPDGSYSWTGSDGSWGRTEVDAATGCTTTTDSTGYEGSWCPGDGVEPPVDSPVAAPTIPSTTTVPPAASTTTLPPGCTVDVFTDGSESGWCEDGSSWWNGADGYWYRTDMDAETGCGGSSSSDGYFSGWCPDGSSWWSSPDGSYGSTTVDTGTGCSTTTDSTGYESTWCPEGVSTTTTAAPATTASTTTASTTTTTTVAPTTTASTTTTTTVAPTTTTSTTTTTTVPPATSSTTSLVPISKSNCTLTAYGNGDESGWCDDGSSFWWGSDGYWSITATSPESGCSVTAASDGGTYGWCDGSGWDQSRSWSTASSGYRSTSVTDVWTGCVTTTDTDGYYDYWCPSTYPDGPAANSACTLDWYSDGSQSGYCDDWSSWWMGTDLEWSITASSQQSGCSVSSGSGSYVSAWCDADGFGYWSWSSSTDGTWYLTEPVRGTDCTRSTDHTGYDDTWCPST